MHIIRPSTGDAANVWLYRDIAMKYKEAANGKQLWNDQWKKSLTECSHGPKCKRVNCEQGKARGTPCLRERHNRGTCHRESREHRRTAKGV